MCHADPTKIWQMVNVMVLTQVRRQWLPELVSLSNVTELGCGGGDN